MASGNCSSLIDCFIAANFSLATASAIFSFEMIPTKRRRFQPHRATKRGAAQKQKQTDEKLSLSLARSDGTCKRIQTRSEQFPCPPAARSTLVGQAACALFVCPFVCLREFVWNVHVFKCQHGLISTKNKKQKQTREQTSAATKTIMIIITTQTAAQTNTHTNTLLTHINTASFRIRSSVALRRSVQTCERAAAGYWTRITFARSRRSVGSMVALAVVVFATTGTRTQKKNQTKWVNEKEKPRKD